MAQVTLDLSELDSIRNGLAEKQKEVLELKNQQIKFEREIEDVKNDKRVVKITKNVPAQMDWQAIQHDVMYKLSHRADRYDRYDNSAGYVMSILQSAFEKGKIKEFNSTEFTNFDDVKEELRNRIEKQVEKELGELRSSKLNNEAEIKRLEADFRLRMEETVKKFNKELIEWEKKYRDLQEDRKELTEQQKLRKEIEELKKDLKTEQDKKWYQKIFNSIGY